ncbi:hypothetical protein CPB85DRAFT_1232225 [Mucidula mucida]|nr:hypothetical protein CPB85DRAFT_1232225 [Mucidula mucida]
MRRPRRSHDRQALHINIHLVGQIDGRHSLVYRSLLAHLRTLTRVCFHWSCLVFSFNDLVTDYDDENYETRFPPDPIYQEASPNARVFCVYMEESKKYDAYMTDEAREGLDVLLVFTGLFSAVLTTFVAQTSQSLQPDRATESTLLLREIAALQRAQMNGTSADTIPPTSADFTPAAIDVWVNGLWFTSLTLSLAAALFAVLIKQWIRQYVSLTSGTLGDRSIMGLQKWHVPALIGILH